MKERTPDKRELKRIYYVYVIKSLKDGRLYTGQTSNLKRRLVEHTSGQTKSIKGRGTFRLVYFETFTNKTAAIKRENFLKTGQGRILKRKLIESFPKEKLTFFQDA